MDKRAEKQIGNMCGHPNTNVWAAVFLIHGRHRSLFMKDSVVLPT